MKRWLILTLFLAAACGSDEPDNNRSAPNNASNNASSPNDSTPNATTPTSPNAANDDWCRQPIRFEAGEDTQPTNIEGVGQNSAGLWAFVEADNGPILLSSDDGRAWVHLVDAVSNGRYFAVSDTALLVVERQGSLNIGDATGQNWTRVEVDLEDEWRFAAYDVLSDGTFVRWVLSNGKAQYSTDAMSWTDIPMTQSAPLAAFRVGEDSIAVTRDGYAEVTDDLGQTWQTITPPEAFGSFAVVFDGADRRFLARSSSRPRTVFESADGDAWTETSALPRDPVPVRFTQVGPSVYAEGGFAGEPIRRRLDDGNWVSLPANVQDLEGGWELPDGWKIVFGDTAMEVGELDGTPWSTYQFGEPIRTRLDDVEIAFGETLGVWSWYDRERFSALSILEDDCSFSDLIRSDDTIDQIYGLFATDGLVVVEYGLLDAPSFDRQYLSATDDQFDFRDTEFGLERVYYLAREGSTHILIGQLNNGVALVRSIDGVEWTDPEPLLLTPETVAAEGAAGPALQAYEFASLGERWVAWTTDRLYQSSDLTNWEHIAVDFGVPNADGPSIEGVAAAGDELWVVARVGDLERERVLVRTTDLSNWTRVDIPAERTLASLGVAGDRLVYSAESSPAFGDIDSLTSIFIASPPGFDLVVEDEFVIYHTWAPGRLMVSRRDELYPVDDPTLAR